MAGHAAVLLALVMIGQAAIERSAAPEEGIALVFEPAPPPPAPPKVVEQKPPPPPPVQQARAEPPAPVMQPAPPQDMYRSALVFGPMPKPRVEPTPHREAVRPTASSPPEPTAAPQTAVASAEPVAVATLVPPRPVAGVATNHAPAYPEIARRRGEQGRVMLRVSVSPSGQPEEVNVLTSSGYPMLDSAALAAVRQWHFVPATQAGTPVAAVAEVPVRFRLEN